MSLYVVATPIGHPDDITLRAIQILKECDVVIGEERSEVSKLLKRLGITPARVELLNEHSKEEDVRELFALCRTLKCALVSDAGTPVFCDPGARLIEICRQNGVTIQPLPGASSLMTLLSMVSCRVNRFVFEGFLPADKTLRGARLQQLRGEKSAFVVMDTPYRLDKTISELAQIFPDRRALLGLDITNPDEKFVEGLLPQIAAQTKGKKAEFVICVYAKTSL